MIARHPHALYNLELKGENTAESLLRAFKSIENKVSYDRFVLSSFNHDDLARARSLNKAFPLAVLYEPSNTVGCPMYSWNPDSTAAYVPFSLEHLRSDTIRSIKPDYFNLNEYDLRPEILRAIQEAYPHARVMVWWWYSEPEPFKNQRLIHTLHQLYHEGLWDMLAAIISDYPAQMIAMLEKEFAPYAA
jgi:glycerophosphoryl diester phosphodiesterase